MLHIAQGNKTGIVGVLYILREGEVQRKNERGVGAFHLVDALIFILSCLEHILNPKLIADAIGAEVVPFIGALEDLRQCTRIIESLQAQIHSLSGGLGLVPVGIEISLTKQRDHPHHRAGIALGGGSFAE